MSSLRTTLAAFPTLLRIGMAETLAYRAEFLVWMLTTTLPLVMMALWTSVAAEAPFGRWSEGDFIAYFLAALIVRNLTGSWVVWQINDEVRRGVMSMRLLRPVHPFVAYAATHLSAVPLRGAVVLPVAAILLVTSGRASITGDPLHLTLLLPSLAAAWVLTFSLMLALGALAFFLDKALSAMDIYFGVFAVMSGYLIPLELLPGWLRALSPWTPFRYMLSAPIEIFLGKDLSTAAALELLGAQVAWAAGMSAVAVVVWRAGVRRFEAVGG
jgi:ABC-2 type transport system permease protein